MSIVAATATLATALHFRTLTAMAPTSAVQWEPVTAALVVEAVRSVTLALLMIVLSRSRRLRLAATSNEGGQPIHIGGVVV